MADKADLSARFRVEPGKAFRLVDRDPRDGGAFAGKDQAKAQVAEDAKAIDALQDRLFAEGKRALLVVLQGIDCAGKDGTVRAVFNTCGPIGVQVNPFKAPAPDELAHDYLWRVHKVCPAKGYIGIFNRSHYEDVLVVKVRKFASPEAIERRYEEINQFERLLVQNGTTILKFMLHISKEEQAERLRERIANPDKRWKFNPGDLDDRALWDDYMAAYDMALQRCSTAHAPWHVIPADRNWVRNAAIAGIVRQTLEDMNPQYPQPKDWDPATVKVV
ncbi:MAG: polyphosphate kinase 2 family protein [Alphaproteobacteria bacterium]|nr:polyphosphate kinase 2 family protein [Alphaproteobacteria bacterium]